MEMFFGIGSGMVLIFALALGVFAGLVKGVVGFSMPTILLSGLGSVASAEVALAGLILPTLATNGWQALRQGFAAMRESAGKHLAFLAAMPVTLIAASQLVPLVPGPLLLLAMGVLVAVFSALQMVGVRLYPPGWIPGSRARAGIGAVAGVMGGVSGIWGPPTVAMLTALNTEKTEQVRVQGVIYAIGAMALVAGHLGSGVLRAQTLPLSAVLVPAGLAGMWLGFRIQDRIDQRVFRRVTLIVLLIGGLNLIRRGLMG